MLKRLYVDNYKCMVNFEFAPGRTQLLLGANGAGKSSVFDVLLLLRQFISGEEKAPRLFLGANLTRWESRDEQAFELEVEGNGGTYLYKLVLEHRRETQQCRVKSETLHFNNQPLLTFLNGEVTIYREDHRAGAAFSFDWSQSAFATLVPRRDNLLHRWFRNWVGELQVVRINPFAMAAQTDREDMRLKEDMTNLASWYRHLVQERPELIEQVRQSLTAVWDGFESIRLETAGPNVRIFKVVLRSAGGKEPFEVALNELSDGQRALIGLYTLLRYAARATGPLICVDEPDNFVALPEIQPWLMGICQAAEDHLSQILFISHHPELINYLAPQDAVILQRTGAGPTRVVPFRSAPDSTLSPAELIARGWERE